MDTCDGMDHLCVVPLHKHKEYVSECVDLLNSEWPRSKTLRLKSLQTSCDTFPTHLVMVYKVLDPNMRCTNCCKEVESSKCDNDTISKEISSCSDLSRLSDSPNRNEIVVGHGKISKLWSVPDGCFIESVIMHKEYRGKGWGKLLMEKIELFIKRLGGVNFIFLTTVDKQSFYNKIGYKATEPIPLFGGTLSSESFNLKSALNRLLISTKSSSLNPIVSCCDFNHSCNFLRSASSKTKSRDLIISTASCYTDSKHNNDTGLHSTIPPPPPPPIVDNLFGKQLMSGHLVDSRKTFMVKVITTKVLTS